MSNEHGYWDPNNIKAGRMKAQAQHRVSMLPPVIPPGPVKQLPAPTPITVEPNAQNLWTGSSIQAKMATGQSLSREPLMIRLHTKGARPGR